MLFKIKGTNNQTTNNIIYGYHQLLKLLFSVIDFNNHCISRHSSGICVSTGTIVILNTIRQIYVSLKYIAGPQFDLINFERSVLYSAHLISYNSSQQSHSVRLGNSTRFFLYIVIITHFNWFN